VSRWALRLATAATLAFLYVPLLIIGIYALNPSRVQRWPPDGVSFEWFTRAFDNPGVREALLTSLKAGLGATAIALVLGTLASFAVARYRFFGRDSISFLVVLPIALPGIVTGMALNTTFTQVLGVELGLFTVICGHATFCVVVVYNNVVARLRRTARSAEEASADLGAHSFETARHITWPAIRSAVVAGALLAFALSFDEVIVTTFTAGQQTTLPIWMLQELIRPRQRPVTNVVAVFIIALTFLPIVAAYWLTRTGEDSPR
jgi:putative spermidine/putrescine transport system permease protein